jgi:glycosyltransferase involved in cell wall biosynthesis
VHADLLHFQWNASAIEYASLFDLLSLPVVISCRGAQISIAPHNPRRSKIVQGLKETLSRASAVHCVSEAIAAEAASFGADPRKTFVIRPAVDPDFFRPLQRALSSENNALRVIATGALIWRKGFEYAITAVRRALDEGVRVNLEIIGDGPDRQRLLYTIHDLGVENEVRLVGRLDPEAVRNELQQSDVYLLSSLSEGIANAALEAMACGLPVVSTACGGMAEVISDGVEGFVVPVRDSAAMADALVRLGRDPQLRRRMGGTARIRILRDHNLTYQAQAFVDLYAKTVN